MIHLSSKLGSGGPQWGTVKLIFLSVYLSVSLSVGSSASIFGKICVDRNCAQRMRPQATGSNSLSGSKICLSVCPTVRSSAGLLLFFYLY